MGSEGGGLPEPLPDQVSSLEWRGPGHLSDLGVASAAPHLPP